MAHIAMVAGKIVNIGGGVFSPDGGGGSGAPSAPSAVMLTNQGGTNPVNAGGSSPGTNSQTIVWTAATAGSHSIDHYKIYRNGSAYDTTANSTTFTYTDTAATNANDALPGSLADGVSFRGPKTPYMYTVSAVDTVSAEGPQSTDLTFIEYASGTDYFGEVDFKEVGTGGSINYTSTAVSHAGSTSVMAITATGTAGYTQIQPSASGPAVPIYSFETGAFCGLNDGYLQFDLYPTKASQVFVVGFVSRVYIPSEGKTDDFYNYAGCIIGSASDGNAYGQAGGAQILGGAPYGPVPMVQNAWNHFKIRLHDMGMGITTFQGYISGTTLTVTTAPTGGFQVVATAWFSAAGATTDYITGAGPSVNLGTSGRGGTGTYSVNVSQTVGSSGSPVTFTLQRTDMYKWSLGDLVYGSTTNLWYMDNIKWTVL
jgi:hypothetical protein